MTDNNFGFGKKLIWKRNDKKNDTNLALAES